MDPSFDAYFEDGIVYISTNSNVSPTNLAVARDFQTSNSALSWQQETVDLTPWVGQTIQVVFYYEAISLGDTVYGWTIDDIGITNVPPGGNISITKNLGQGTWSLSSVSPLGLVPVQSGTWPSVTVSNLAAGQYVAQFSDVPYYETPASQTNTLVVGGTLNFTGNYTFVDANHNGISDAWEMQYFGVVSTNETQFTDTDRNGMSDYAKFIAGLNPTNPASKFEFVQYTAQTNRTIQLQWSVASQRLYQVYSAPNLLAWTPLTGWMQAASDGTMSCTMTNTGRPNFVRVQVEP